MIQYNLGKFGEDIALSRLNLLGYNLVERNFSNHYGEIDLILKDKNTLVFVEVKTVSLDTGYAPVEQITKRKLQHLKNTIDGYLSYRRISPKQIYRLDFVGIVIGPNNQVVKFDHRTSIG